jgi:hypothetical protein
MTRIAAALLSAFFLLGPSLASGAGDDAEEEHRTHARSDQVEESAAQPLPSQAEIRRLAELPIYVPPNRGSIPTRVGGASRGGRLPGRRL